MTKVLSKFENLLSIHNHGALGRRDNKQQEDEPIGGYAPTNWRPNHPELSLESRQTSLKRLSGRNDLCVVLGPL